MTVQTKRDVVILPDAAAITRRAADEFLKCVNQAIAEKDSFTVALAGGSTPKALYSLLSEDPAYARKIPWGKLRFFFGDERHVPPDSTESNFHMANETLFSKGLIKPEQRKRRRPPEREAFFDPLPRAPTGAFFIAQWRSATTWPQLPETR